MTRPRPESRTNPNENHVKTQPPNPIHRAMRYLQPDTESSKLSLFITSLANDPGVSIEESMQSAGHKSVAAQRPYIVPNGVSETAKFTALGIRR